MAESDKALVAEHPKRDALARVVRSAAWSAADELRVRLSDGLAELLEDESLSPEDGKIGNTDVLALLDSGDMPKTQAREVLSALLAHGVALSPPASIDDGRRLAQRLSWLSAHSFFDASAVIEVLDDETGARLLRGLAEVVRRVDQRGAAKGRGKALAALAALALSQDALATELRAELAGNLKDPLLVASLGVAGPSPVAARAVPLQEVTEEAEPAVPEAATDVKSRLGGRVVPAPMGPLALFFWCATGLIWLRWAWRFVTGVLLRMKRPATVSIDPSGVTIEAQTKLLGRTIRERKTLVPLDNVARAVRDVRYPRLALYAGLLALALGSYLGVTFFLEGSGSGSPSLMALGAAVFGAGVVLDFLLSGLIPSRRGRSTLLLYPRKGRALALATDNSQDTDALLRRLAQLS